MGEEAPKELEFSQAAQQCITNLKAVADLAGQGLSLTDPQTHHFVACNATFCEQLGYSESELLELGPLHIQADPDRNAAWVEREVGTILQSGLGRFQGRHRAKDGTAMEVWISHTVMEFDGRSLVLSLVTDRTQERFREFQQQQTIKLLHQGEQISGAGSWSLRLSDGRLQFSALAARICHLDPEAPPPNLWGFTALIHRDDRSRFRSDLRRALARGEDLQGRYRLELIQDAAVTVQLEGRVVLDDDGKPIEVNGTVSDVSHSESSEVNLERLRRLDGLTHLPNKAAITELLQRLLTGRGYGNSLAVLSLDLDGFQEINDGFGTDFGDALLIAVADQLRELCGGDGDLGRIGSDEFVLVIERGIHSLGDAMLYARHLEQRWANLPPLVKGLDANPTFCCGFACYPEHAQQAEVLLQSANTALTAAKRSGRGQIKPYSSTLSRQIKERLDLGAELAQAIAREQLRLQLQPQFTTDGALVGAEVLLRWTNSRGVAISPAQFIDLAEQTGQIFSIGRWVLHQTLQQIQIWQEQGLVVPRIAINLSARELERPIDQLLGGLQEAMASYGVRPDQLELEITETALLSNPLQASQKLSEIAGQGFRLAIDDFGTGYSSLELLRNLPIHKLKIDKTFIDGIVQSPPDATIVRSIIILAKGMGLTCVAEGVELPDQLEYLAELGCEVIQGYIYSKPIDPDQFTLLLQEHADPEGSRITIVSSDPSCELPAQRQDDRGPRLPSPMEQMELWRGAVELSQDCYILLRAERDATGAVSDFLIIDLNLAASEYMQQGKDAFIGQYLLSIFPNAISSGLMETCINAVQTSTPVELEGFAYPSHDLFKDDRVYDISVYPLRGFLILDWRDVTSRHQQHADLTNTADHFRLLAENIVEVVLLLNDEQQIEWVSQSLQPVTGWTPMQWQGQSFSSFFGSEASPPQPVDLAQWMERHGEIRQDRLRLKDPLGHWIWVAVSAKRLVDASPAAANNTAASTGTKESSSPGYVITVQPVDEQVVYEQRLLRMAHRDPLTGLETRGAILGWLKERLQDERALSAQPLALLFCDFDNFKGINDTLGHGAGDAVLQTVATRIRHLIRSQDHAGRLGGDEFLVLLEGVQTERAASLIGEKLRLAVAEPISWEEHTITATLSIGVAIHDAGETADAFLERADQAMYAAKQGGRNRVMTL